MKIYILNTPEQSCNYVSSISEKFNQYLDASGILYADEIANTIIKKGLNIDKIFSSPFLNSLQFSYPLAKKINKKICIEYSLYPFLNNNIGGEQFMTKHFNEHFFGFNYLFDYVNSYYESFTLQSNISCFESINEMNNRVNSFIYSLSVKYKEKKGDILFVTHVEISDAINNFLNNNNNIKFEILNIS
jgi:broad specificity phosphatase PhoE